MVSQDADRLVWEASTLLSDARPPSDFIVYNRQGDMTPPPEYEQQLQQEQLGQGHQQQLQQAAPPPPIFDGSVANATPPPLGAGAIGAGGSSVGGGSGTILHLACALDRPLFLAFLMCMGADARASHTAFRRLMIHEAACNGSIGCLTLLLELGHEFATKSSQHQQQQNLQPQGTLPNVPGRHYGFESYNPHIRRPNPTSIPFFPHGASAFGERSSYPTNDPRPLSFRHQFRRPEAGTGFRQGHAKDDDCYTDAVNDQSEFKDKMDFLTLLRHFQRCYTNVQSGIQTELEAARSLLANAWLPDTTRLSLIRSCVFQKNDSSSPHARSPSSSFLLHRPQGCADGHGNTPLHWAAFKNETACVGLLLEYNADANARAHPSGWTPLHDAAYSDSSDSIELLIHKGGAQVDARANSGATPLCFAAQEDASNAARLLLELGADLSARCAGGPSPFQAPPSATPNGHHQQPPPPPPPPPHSRFSGYTPLHYCAHYNAHSAAKVLLRHESAKKAMETTDLSDRLPIHVAVARGSSDVLRELLHAGARIDTRPKNSLRSLRSSSSSISSGRSSRSSRSGQLRQPGSPAGQQHQVMAPAVGTLQAAVAAAAAAAPVPDFLVAAAIGRIVGGANPGTPVRRPPTPETPGGRRSTTPTGRTTPVSSPLLRSMIPSQPITSSKPWNCLTQHAIDECRALISKAEQSWSPDCHLLFTPQDRKAVMELLRVGKRLEQQGTGLCVRDVWPLILSFCGRGWFEPHPQQIEQQEDDMQGLVVGDGPGSSIPGCLSIRTTLSADDSMEEEDEQMGDFDDEEGGDDNERRGADDYLALPNLSR